VSRRRRKEEQERGCDAARKEAARGPIETPSFPKMNEPRTEGHAAQSGRLTVPVSYAGMTQIRLLGFALRPVVFRPP